MKRYQLLIGLAGTFLVIGLSHWVLANEGQLSPEPNALSSDANTGNPDNGQVVYETYCFNCHGSEGRGDGPVGQTLVPPAADLTIIGEKSDQDLLKTIREGRPGTAMPSWTQDLSAKEILDVLSYLRSLSQ